MPNRPTICLNMIVRNEAHVVHEILDCVAPYLDYWVIVDTGSDDGTQDVIRHHLAGLGIPGELHERPWRNFGANRSEALDLARGHGDYIWVVDADDLVVGELDLSDLTDDAYELRFGQGFTYWRPQILKNGLPWSYRGVVHEYLHCEQPFIRTRLEGDYHLESRRLGNRSADPEKYARDRDLLLVEVERNPDDERSVFYLAQSYFDYGDFESALTWYRRRAEMGRWAQEVYYSLYRVAECLARLDQPWPVVLDAYLKAWAYRPTRAEPLCAIATRYMAEREWQLGHFFAERAAAIPIPDDDILFVRSDIYTFSSPDVQSVCAYWLGSYEESFTLCRRLLDLDHIDESHRARVARNRDFSVPAMVEAAADYPEDLARSLPKARPEAPVTVTVAAGPDPAATERTLNSFLRCCRDIDRVGRIVLTVGELDDADRSRLLDRYPFLDIQPTPEGHPAAIRRLVADRFWLHIPPGWQFFAPEHLITRLIAVLEAEPEVNQIGVNVDDAAEAKGAFAPPEAVRRATGTGRYAPASTPTTGPAMYDTSRWADGDRTGLRTATLDDMIAVGPE